MSKKPKRWRVTLAHIMCQARLVASMVIQFRRTPTRSVWGLYFSRFGMAA